LFAIGHFAIGYLTGKASAKALNVQLNMPLLLTASVIPDIDLLLRFIHHRGPTHSIITIIALTIPFLIYYRKTAVPYAVALASHSLIGDFFTGGVQLFWPLSREMIGALNIDVNSLTNSLLELALFIVSIVVMFKTGDLRKIVSDKYKLALLLPFGAVLGPMLAVGRGQEYALPLLLVIPSLFYLALFAYSMLVGKQKKPKNQK
jgi:membrane-bound metal-dependent hydrolase YbcI (DUF457 family)